MEVHAFTEKLLLCVCVWTDVRLTRSSTEPTLDFLLTVSKLGVDTHLSPPPHPCNVCAVVEQSPPAH